MRNINVTMFSPRLYLALVLVSLGHRWPLPPFSAFYVDPSYSPNGITECLHYFSVFLMILRAPVLSCSQYLNNVLFAMSFFKLPSTTCRPPKLPFILILCVHGATPFVDHTYAMNILLRIITSFLRPLFPDRFSVVLIPLYTDHISYQIAYRHLHNSSYLIQDSCFTLLRLAASLLLCSFVIIQIDEG